MILADLSGDSEGLAETEEVVGLVGKADEAAGETADAALKADGLFPFFVELEEDVDGAILGVALDFCRLFGIELLE